MGSYRQSAGMTYFVITSKHHDGFALYPSNIQWNVSYTLSSATFERSSQSQTQGRFLT